MEKNYSDDLKSEFDYDPILNIPKKSIFKKYV